MFRLFKITIIKFRIAEVSKEVNHIAINSMVQLAEDIPFLYKIYVEITFGKHFYNMQKYCKILLVRKK